VFILDRSGSMSVIKSDTEGGFNTFIEEQKKVAGEVKVSLYQFDTQYESVYERVPLKEVRPLVLTPRGSTALHDAIGRTIDAVGARLASTPEADRPAKIVIVTLTDGEENASREYTATQIAEKVKHQTDKYSWEFVFIGSNQDAVVTAGNLGIAKGNTITFANNSKGTQNVFRSYSSKLCASRDSLVNTGAYTVSSFTDEDRKEAMVDDNK
jgi:uncharacterized protein YegL